MRMSEEELAQSTEGARAAAAGIGAVVASSIFARDGIGFSSPSRAGFLFHCFASSSAETDS